MSERTRQKRKTKNLLMRCLKRNLSAPEFLTVSQWAEKYRILDDSSALPGRWSNSITPYAVEIMDRFNDPYVESINFVKPSQVGGTEIMINILGWIAMMNPSPTMLVYPDKNIIKDISTDKLQPAFNKSPALSERFIKSKSSISNLKFKGMNLYMRSANSPTQMASKAIKYLFFDEIDKIPGASKKEASPYNLAKERTKTFQHTRKIYTCSTPTLRSNYVWQLHEEADEVRHYFVPCPHCGEMIELLWSQVRYEKDDEKKMTAQARASTAVYVCQQCGAVIENKQKPAMLKKGEWQTTVKRCIGKAKSVSYWINSLYSFFVTWEMAALEFLQSKDDPEKLQNFVNSWLGEVWEDTKLKTSAELVLERQNEYEQLVVPDWAELLTGGVDVQENCLYFDVVAWGKRETSSSIYHGQCMSFAEISRIMNGEYTKRSGEKMIVKLCGIDSGDQTDDVYNFCMYNSDWAIAMKGIDGGNNHYKMSSVNRAGSSYQGLPLVLVDGGKYKDLIAARLQKPNGIGAFMVHKDCDIEYAEQLTAEHKVAEGTGVKRRLVWRQKVSHGDNHYLDCRVYASCAADILGVRMLGRNAENLETETEQNQIQREENINNGWINNNMGSWL